MISSVVHVTDTPDNEFGAATKRPRSIKQIMIEPDGYRFPPQRAYGRHSLHLQGRGMWHNCIKPVHVELQRVSNCTVQASNQMMKLDNPMVTPDELSHIPYDIQDIPEMNSITSSIQGGGGSTIENQKQLS